MPIYEYVCGVCSSRFERRRAVSEMSEPAVCSDCGAEARRVFSVFAAFSASDGGRTEALAGAVGCCGGGAGGCACAAGV